MDEFNSNTSNGKEPEEKTPFQTPVRGVSGGGAQTNGSSSFHSEAGGSNLGETSGNPYHQNTSNPYSQWGNSGNSGNGKGPKKPGKGPGKGPKLIALAAVVAVIAFVGGMAAGGGLDFSTLMGNQPSTTTESGSGLPTDSTKVQISTTKNTGSGESGDDGLSSTEIYEAMSPSIVSIVVDDITVGSEASGSGVIMSADGYIITNDHVVEGGNKFTVILSDSTQYDADLVGTDSQTDLAVLKIKPKSDLTVAEFGDSDELTVGDRCYAIGSPGGVEFQNSFTGGFVSAIDRNVTLNDRVMTLIQTDAAINPGSSGGALINKYGQVIGITSSKLSSASSTTASYEGMGFAIPMSTTQDVVNELIAYGHVTGRPAIGISGYDIDANTAKYYDVPQGVLVSSVDQASNAYEKGIQANDIITAVNGKDVTSMSDINTIKEKCEAGDTMTLTIYRSGKTKKIKITLMDQNDLTSASSNSDESSESSSGTEGMYGYGYGNNDSFSSGFGY